MNRIGEINIEVVNIKISINKASEIVGVSINTLRRWEKEGKITSERTKGGHRRYDNNSLLGLINKGNEKLSIAYCRVSSFDQKDDLIRQINTVSEYCIARGYQFRIIQDLGSGLNYNKKGLKELIELICSQRINRIIINYKDRLIRYGYEIIENICELNGVKIEIINHTEDKTYEQELVEDVLSIITVFSSKLYGSRSHKIKKIKEEFIKLMK